MTETQTSLAVDGNVTITLGDFLLGARECIESREYASPMLKLANCALISLTKIKVLLSCANLDPNQYLHFIKNGTSLVMQHLAMKEIMATKRKVIPSNGWPRTPCSFLVRYRESALLLAIDLLTEITTLKSFAQITQLKDKIIIPEIDETVIKWADEVMPEIVNLYPINTWPLLRILEEITKVQTHLIQEIIEASNIIKPSLQEVSEAPLPISGFLSAKEIVHRTDIEEKAFRKRLKREMKKAPLDSSLFKEDANNNKEKYQWNCDDLRVKKHIGELRAKSERPRNVPEIKISRP